ncbi:hypothetical protein [Duganella sp.]|uniref:hypothetical protein n=1 Tax=Duganella sp. TaxID=1904440 RepID=UPI0031DB48EA
MSKANSAQPSIPAQDEPVQIAVIGGGPKAAAIAAKAWALRERGVADIRAAG